MQLSNAPEPGAGPDETPLQNLYASLAVCTLKELSKLIPRVSGRILLEIKFLAAAAFPLIRAPD